MPSPRCRVSCASPAGGWLHLLPAIGLYVGICLFAVWIFNREAPKIAEEMQPGNQGLRFTGGIPRLSTCSSTRLSSSAIDPNSPVDSYSVVSMLRKVPSGSLS